MLFKHDSHGCRTSVTLIGAATTNFVHAPLPTVWLNTGSSPLLKGLAMPNVEPNRLAATTLVRLIEGGELTAEAIVQSCLERIAEREPVVRAWSHLAGEAALARARERDRSAKKTLLNGVPFGLKDIFDSADMPTTYGSPIYVGWRPANDASAASLPRAAGGILLGKTVSTE